MRDGGRGQDGGRVKGQAGGGSEVKSTHVMRGRVQGDGT